MKPTVRNDPARLYWHRLERRADDLFALKRLANMVRQDPRLPSRRQRSLLQAIQQRIWLRSVAEFDGCG